MTRKSSITSRLTAWFAAIATAVLLVLGLLLGNAVEQHFVEQDMDLLNGKTHLIAHLLEQVRSPDDLTQLPRQLTDALVGHHDLAVAVMTADGHRLFATPNVPPNVPFADATLHATTATAPQPASWIESGHPWRSLTTLLPTASPGMSPLRVAVAVDISHHEHFMDSFRRSLWLLIATAAMLVGVLGWASVRRELQPLQALRAGAAEVTASRLDYRLPLDSVPVELAELAETLNAMLARLEESFQRLKDFSSDLAHELRTPISNLMTETQVALSRARSAEEYREVLASNAEEYERLARMTGDMLFLAQAENGLLVPRHETVDLAQQVRELLDFFDALAEEKGLRITLSGEGSVSGDPLMLRRALANLIANAIRHTPHSGTIKVRINRHEDTTTLSIENSGQPIPPEHLARIFDRFYRADPSRHSTGEGAGLGLAITRSIIHAHGGRIDAQPTAHGMCFTLGLKQ